MRIALRLALALVALLVLGLAALAVLLPRLIDSPGVRSAIERQAREAVGREVRYAGLSVGLLPPRLVVDKPEVAGDTPEAPPLVAAESLGLRLELLPLFAGAVLIDEIVVDGATLRLERTAQGLTLPPLGQREAGKPRGEPAPPAEAEAEADGLALAVRSASLRNCRVILTDRTTTPPAVIELREIDATAGVEALDAPIPFEVSAVLASGGRLRAAGTGSAAGAVDARLELSDVALQPFSVYLGQDGARLGGKLGGRIEVSGSVPDATELTADLALDDADVKLEDIELRGALTLRAELSGPATALGGPFELDATKAELAYGESFRKPSGTSATASGRLVPDQGVQGLRVKLHNLDATGALRAKPRSELLLSAPPFEAGGWERLVPALADYELSGPVEISELRVAAAPLSVRGGIGFKALRAVLPDTGVVQLDGRVEGEGDGLRTRDLRVALAGQRIELDGRLLGLAGTPRYDARVRTVRADTNALLSALSETENVLFGPLDLDLRLAGSLPDWTLEPEALTGEAQLAIACPDGAESPECRVRGVSLLRSTFERLGPVGQAALAAAARSGKQSIQRFFNDEFRSITGSFRIANARARSDDLKLVYRGYTVDLRGAIGLLDRSLDATGKLTIEEELDAAVASTAVEGGASRGRRKVIPLARVTGTLQNPRIDLSPDAVVAFASSFAIERERGDLARKIDEKLGEGSGEAVIDALEGILGGGRR